MAYCGTNYYWKYPPPDISAMPYGVGGGMIQKIQQMEVERELYARIVYYDVPLDFIAYRRILMLMLATNERNDIFLLHLVLHPLLYLIEYYVEGKCLCIHLLTRFLLRSKEF